MRPSKTGLRCLSCRIKLLSLFDNDKKTSRKGLLHLASDQKRILIVLKSSFLFPQFSDWIYWLATPNNCPFVFKRTAKQKQNTGAWYYDKCHNVTAFLHDTGGYCVRVKMPRLEEVANVVLRVPASWCWTCCINVTLDSFTDHLRARTEDMLFKYNMSSGTYIIWVNIMWSSWVIIL